MTRSEGTEKCWPDETLVEMLDRVRREHGDKVADLIAQSVAAPTRKKQVPSRVGNKEKPRPAIPRAKPRMTRAEAMQMMQHYDQAENDRHKGRRGYNKSGLPNSGAPRGDRS